MQYYPQPQQHYPQQPYPAQQYPQPYQPQYPQQIPQNCPAPQYSRPTMTPEEYRQYDYRRRLRSAANSVGTLLLIFFGLELLLALVAQIVLIVSGLASDLFDTDMLLLLENGMISSLIFFLAGLIYCLIKRYRFAEIFPFDKINGGLLAKLCVIGLSFSLMSNYVVSLLNNTFGLFGIENSGGSIDTGNSPNILLYFLTVAILPAFAEEFAFRGIVMGALRPYSEGLAILVSSATFALMHGNFVQLPFTFCCGIVFAFIDIKTNSLLPSIIIHFLNNGLSVLFDILTAYGIVNETGANMWYGIIFLVTGVLSFIFLKGMIGKDDGSFFTLKGGNDVLPFKRKVTTVASSPTMISYTVLMLLYCVAYLIFL